MPVRKPATAGGRAPGLRIDQRRPGADRPPGRPFDRRQPVALERDLVADAEVRVDRPLEPAALLELGPGQQASVDQHAEALVVEPVEVGVQAHRPVPVSRRPGWAARLARRTGRRPPRGLAEGTAHCGSGGATNRPSETRSP